MYLGIDIGTSKAAAALVDEAGRPVAAAARRHGADLPAEPGHAEQDVGALLEAAWAAARGLPAGARAQVRAVGLTGQMHGVTLLDAGGRSIAPLVTWQDQRARADGSAERLQQRTGHRLSTGFGCVTLAWLAEHGRLPAGAAAASTIHDLAAARLCGLRAPVSDPTGAASWGLFDLRSLSWDRRAAAGAGVPLHLLPRVVPVGAEIGPATDGMARALGIPAGAAVVAAIGDNQASLLATVRDPDHELALTLGTGGQVSAPLAPGETLEQPAPTATWEIRPYVDGRRLVVASSLCGGAAWEWLCDAVRSAVTDLGLEPPPPARVYARLNALGLAAAEELDVAPHLLGERHDPSLRGSIGGLDPGNCRLGPLARGLARGIVRALRDLLPPQALEGRTAVVASGNALRRNRLLRHMAAEVFSLPVVQRRCREEAAVGAALLCRAHVQSVPGAAPWAGAGVQTAAQETSGRPTNR